MVIMKEIIEAKEGLRAFPQFPLALVTMPGQPPNIIVVALIHVFSFKPFLLGVGIGHSRYSHELLKAAKDFVVNIPTKELLDQVQFCGTESGRNVDKFEKTRFKDVAAQEVESPLIDECPVNYECRITQTIETGDHTWFIGEVLVIHRDVSYTREMALSYWAGEYRLPGNLLRRR
jgi:flavin reductase (DIM6/NTAB) family NADH-FMN oxidoreductase RutF